MVTVQIDRKEIAQRSRDMDLYTVEEIERGKWKVIAPDGEERIVQIFEVEHPEYLVSCTCEDFQFRKHVCKHIAKVLRESYDVNTDRFNVPKEEEMKFEEIKFEEKEEPLEEVEDLKEDEKKKEKAEKVAKNTQILLMADQEDEKLAEQLGVMMPNAVALEDYPLVYSFTDRNGKEHRFLSLAGWIKAARIQGNIEVKIDKIIEHGGKTAVVAIAKDLRRNVEMPGLSTRATRAEFELEILASKAIRNALKKVVDPEIVQRILTMADERGQIRRLEVVWQ